MYQETINGADIKMPKRVLCVDSNNTALSEGETYEVLTVIQIRKAGEEDLTPMYAICGIDDTVFDMERFIPLTD